MTAWTDYVKKYREDHVGLSYKEALTAASEPYKTMVKTTSPKVPKVPKTKAVKTEVVKEKVVKATRSKKDLKRQILA